MPLGSIEIRKVNVRDQTGKPRDEERWYVGNAGSDVPIPPEALRPEGWGKLAAADIVDKLDIEFDYDPSQPQPQIGNVRRYAAVSESARRLLDQHDCQHPGLLLDKFAYRWSDQSHARGILEKVADADPGFSGWYPNLLRRWQHALQVTGAVPFWCTTTGPLSLHLSRASALENANICLHPVYGFVYLPGTGLKGLAHAYACEVWLPTQTDGNAGWRTICSVFGVAPSPWLRTLSTRLKLDRAHVPIEPCAGAVVFHDAWPAGTTPAGGSSDTPGGRWPGAPDRCPKLTVDIVNNHHRKYYEGKDREDAPGDWEEPNPVYFLALGPNATFQFALSPRRADESEFLAQAMEWLVAALTHEGAGAKTAAGYGRFRLEDNPPDTIRERAHAAETTWAASRLAKARDEFVTTIELVTPAFLAGAKQRKHDCDLRPATVRGLLRWWWRTMHVGFVEVDTLRQMEAAMWGDTKVGGAVRLAIQSVPASRPSASLVAFKSLGQTKEGKDTLLMSDSFVRSHDLSRPATPKTSQGVLYASFGMDEMKVGDLGSRKTRFYMRPGAKWQVCISARDSSIEICSDGGSTITKGIAASVVLEQARCALWLLCHLGGVGSKSRKGFGSFADPTNPDDLAQLTFDSVLEKAAAFRGVFGLESIPFNSSQAHSPSLRQMRDLTASLGLLQPWLESEVAWADPWRAIDELGTAAQSFAQADPHTRHGKHCKEKLFLGLPRKIDRNPSRQLIGFRGERYASPVFYHVGKDVQGRHVIRVSAFPAKELRPSDMNEDEGLKQSNLILKSLLMHLQIKLPPPPAPLRPPPAPPKMQYAAGTVISKTGRNATVKLDSPLPDGQTEIPVGGAKKLVEGQKVKVQRLGEGRWEPRS